MKLNTLCIAIREAREFIERAEIILARDDNQKGDVIYSHPARINGDCLRASMDLTRILSKLRHGK